MKAVLIPVILGLIGLAGGVGAAKFLGVGEKAELETEEANGAAKTDDKADTGEKDSDAESDEETEFARLNNQFIVPVVQNERVAALVVLSVTLEVSPGGTEQVFSQEPRLRDRFLRVLFDHANIGGFDVGFTQSGTMTLLRQSLLEAAQQTLGDVVKGILIVDIVRQEA